MNETQQLQELKDYKDKLFRKEGGRGRILSGGFGRGATYKDGSWFGPLHLSFCSLCNACYYRRECVIGDPNLVYLGRGFRDAIRRILRR